MEDVETIKSVANELGNTRALLGFEPAGAQVKHFLGEAILVAAAGIFVTAFLGGVNDALKAKGKELGEKVTNWLIDKLEGLFKTPQTSGTDQTKSENDLKALGKAAAGVDKTTVTKRLDTAEKAVSDTLQKRGVMPVDAKRVAHKTRKAAEGYIARGGTSGPK